MAGRAISMFGGRGGGSVGGREYDPRLGGFVAPQPKTVSGNPVSITQREATRPAFETSPTGDVFQYDADDRIWRQMGNVPAGGSLPGASAGRAGGRSGIDQNALNALLGEIRSTPQARRLTPSPVTQRTGDPYDQAAESAAYGRAKDRTGLALQSALRGLQGQMASRGIRGSTIQGDRLQGLFEGGLGELAETDRGLAENQADRAFDAENIDLSRLEQGRQFNDSFLQGEEGRVQNSAERRLQAILQAYGMFY